ncbi:MAG: phosphatidylserine decarboxylase family protein [Lentisphaeria bacterium]|nr:phosphatidylserine decarboxylase family protein [Lentisphaeria bacterium]
MTLTKYGFKEWGLAFIINGVLIALCWLFLSKYSMAATWILTVFFTIVFLAIAAFFRNPSRHIPTNINFLVSPADGTVRDIEVVEDFDQSPFNGEALRIGIFLSVLNVHVNRSCADFQVESVNYRKGEYLDARHAECAKRNEAMTIAGTATMGDKNFPMAIRQISGAIARRIVCPVQAGAKLKKGQLYGMIKFGSRTEIYLPKDQFDLKVKIGDKVRGGETIIAEIK